MSTSQQLVRKLLKATSVTSSSSSQQQQQPAPIRPPAASSQQSSSHPSKRPRKKKDAPLYANDDVAIVVGEQDIVAWHTQLILATDRTMTEGVSTTVSSSSRSNAAAFGKLLSRQERTSSSSTTTTTTTTGGGGAARTSTSSLTRHELIKIPTYNKQRYEQVRRERKRWKLAQALEKLNAVTKHNTTTKKKKSKTSITKPTLFG
jgi:hypothetical protein